MALDRVHVARRAATAGRRGSPIRCRRRARDRSARGPGPRASAPRPAVARSSGPHRSGAPRCRRPGFAGGRGTNRSRGMLATAASTRSSPIAGRRAYASSRAWRGDITRAMGSIARQRPMTRHPASASASSHLSKNSSASRLARSVRRSLSSLRGLLGVHVPVQHDLAVVDRDDLDPIGALGVGQERRLAPLARDDQLVGAVGLHWSACSSAAVASGTAFGPDEDAIPDLDRRQRRHAGLSRAPGRVAPGRLVCLSGSIPLRSAVGCISQAAPAIRIVSSSPRSRPPANAWRKAASENATPRPMLLGVGRRAASRVRCRVAIRSASGAAAGRARRRRARSGRGRGGGRSVRDQEPSTGSHSGTTGKRRHDRLGDQVAIAGCRGRSRRPAATPRYPWISQPSAARPASMTASDRVGWPWMIRATSG